MLEKNEKIEKVEDKLVHEIEELNEKIEKQNSYWHGFFGGIFKGIGYAFGASILFGILITVLSYIVRTSDAQWVKQVAEWAQLSEYTN